MRKLVTIRQVSEVIEIPEATNIELVKIDGWQCVAKKGEFKPNSAAVYFEVDSFLPESDQRYSFMAGRGLQTNGDGSKGYRLRTIRLRKMLSQGLALPLEVFPELTQHGADEERDLAELLGVTKWEPALPACLSGQAKGTFPAFLKKTDQERIQNMPWILKEDGEYEITQKLDGSSCTIFWNNGAFGVCSRNLELTETEGNSFWQIANKYNLREAMETLGMNIAIQGELIGPGIQMNPHKLSAIDFFVFDVFLINTGEYASHSERNMILGSKALEHLKTVPLIGFRSIKGMTVDQVLKLAEETVDRLNPANPAPEGLVFKRLDGLQSMKAISNKYLMKEK